MLKAVVIVKKKLSNVKRGSQIEAHGSQEATLFLINQKAKQASSVFLQPKRHLSSPPNRRWRIALYSHDTMGLGHKRRNLLIAQTLGASKLDADILLISGMRDASDLPTPDGVDSLTLPALHKRADGHYEARRMSMSLEDIIRLRAQIILTAIQKG